MSGLPPRRRSILFTLLLLLVAGIRSCGAEAGLLKLSSNQSTISCPTVLSDPCLSSEWTFLTDTNDNAAMSSNVEDVDCPLYFAKLRDYNEVTSTTRYFGYRIGSSAPLNVVSSPANLTVRHQGGASC